MRLIFIALLLFSAKSWALVDIKNANYSEAATDLKLAGSGFDLRIKRSYNSRTLFSGIFGFGWCSEFETSLQLTPQNTIRITECGGGLEITYRQPSFKSKSFANTINTIVARVKQQQPHKTPNQLKKLRAQLHTRQSLRAQYIKKFNLGGRANLKEKYIANHNQDDNIVFNGQYYKRSLPDESFQRFNKKGQLTHMYDKNKNYLKIARANNKIATVTDNMGRHLKFSYHPGTQHIKQVVASNGTQALYTFKGETLVRVTNSDKKSYVYQYDDLINLVRITFPDKTFKSLMYNKDRDWVVGFRDRMGCIEKYNYIVNPNNKKYYKSTVKKTCKGKVVNKSVYEFWYKKSLDGYGKFLSRTRSNNNGKVREVVYHNVFGRPVYVAQKGQKIKLKYYKTGRLKSRETQDSLVSYKYDPLCRKASEVASYFYAPNKKRKPTTKQPMKKINGRQVQKILKTKFKYQAQKCHLIVAENSEGFKVHLEYDGQGRIVKMIDQSKKHVRIQYNERTSLPSRVIRPGLGTIDLSYKKNGEIDKIKSQEGPRVAIQVASIFNNVLSIIALTSVDLKI